MFQRILVPIDGSPTARLALERAIDLAGEQKACLRIIEVVDLGILYRVSASAVETGPVEQAIITAVRRELDAAAELARQRGIAVEAAVVRGREHRISREIVEEAERWGADLIVMGTHGRHGLERLVLGSVAEGVARQASVPVLLVRAPQSTAG